MSCCPGRAELQQCFPSTPLSLYCVQNMQTNKHRGIGFVALTLMQVVPRCCLDNCNNSWLA